MPWSDWQSPWVAPFDISQTGKYFRYLFDSEGDASSSAAIAPLAATAKATINSGGGTAGPSAGSLEVLATTQAGRQTGGVQNTQVYVELGYSAAVFDAAAGEAFAPSGTPQALAALTFGVDYTTIPVPDRGPYTVGFVDYEGPGQAFSQWDVLHGDMNVRFNGVTNGLLPNPLPFPLRFWGDTALTPHTGNATAGPSLSYAPSNVIGDVDFSIDYSTFDYAQDVGDLDISSQAEAFTLIVQCRWQGSTAVVTDEITSGPGHSYTVTVYSHGVPTARALYTSPRWRYWMVEDDRLRTIGDHFRSIGGAQIKSLIPGVGWIPVRRGT